MKVEQISVFLENQPGGIEYVTRVLEEDNFNIRALSLANTSGSGILQLIVDDVEPCAMLFVLCFFMRTGKNNEQSDD